MKGLFQRLHSWVRPMRSVVGLILAELRQRVKPHRTEIRVQLQDGVEVTTVTIHPGTPLQPPESPLAGFPAADQERIAAIVQQFQNEVVPGIARETVVSLHRLGAADVALRTEPQQPGQPEYVTVVGS
jgi:hypothetical protein